VNSLEAAFPLVGPIPAGSWHLVGDGIVMASCDVQFDVVWRHGEDSVLASVSHHFDPRVILPKFDATQFEADANGVAAQAASGDQLVLRLTASVVADAGAGVTDVFIPNGDGANAHGRIPSLTLPR
jgi:hypothetical protein